MLRCAALMISVGGSAFVVFGFSYLWVVCVDLVACLGFTYAYCMLLCLFTWIYSLFSLDGTLLLRFVSETGFTWDTGFYCRLILIV